MSTYRVPIQFTYSHGGSPGTNVWHVRTVDTEAGAAETQLQNAVDAIRDFYVALDSVFAIANGIFAPGTVFNLGTPLNVETEEDANPTFDPLTAGSGGTDLPPHLAICVNWKTSSRTRRGRGRTFLGPLASTCMEVDGTVRQNVRDAITTAANALVAESAGIGGWAVGVWGLQNPAPAGSPPEYYNDAPRVIRDITGVGLFAANFAVMRSRRQ